MFDNGKIIIQADPYASGIFKINHEKHFEEKVRIYKDNKKEFMEQLFTKTNEISKNIGIDKNRQNIEAARMEKQYNDFYEEEIQELYEKNFYNIIEKISPLKVSNYKEGNKNILMLIYFLKN